MLQTASLKKHLGWHATDNRLAHNTFTSRPLLYDSEALKIYIWEDRVDVIDCGSKEYSLHVVGLLLHTAAQIVLTPPAPAMGAVSTVFLGRPAKWTRWLTGAAAIKCR